MKKKRMVDKMRPGMSVIKQQQSHSQSMIDDRQYVDQYRPNLYNILKNFKAEKVQKTNSLFLIKSYLKPGISRLLYVAKLREDEAESEFESKYFIFCTQFFS
jgi:hypothetical protein